MTSTNQILQNEKYQSCINACFECAESCEYCATCCLREQDVKMLARCIQLDRDCATICLTAAAFMHEIATMQNKSVRSALTFVKLVLRSVKNTPIWTIVKNALKPVEDVLTSVEGCLVKLTKEGKKITYRKSIL